MTDKYKRQKDYLKSQDEIKVRMAAGNKEAVQDYAASHGWKSLNQFVVNLIDYAMTQGLTAESVQTAIREHHKKA